MKALVASGDEMVRHVAAKTLRTAGYSVVAVHDGEKAWREMDHETAPLIAVLDWDLSLYDGVSLSRSVRSTQFRDYIYVLLLASRRNKLDELVALESGIDDYLLKPFLADELLARVNIGRRVIEHERKLTGIINGYRAMTDLGPFAIACTDDLGTLRRINLPFARLLGVESPGSLINRNIAEVLALSRDEATQLLRQVQEHREMEIATLHPAWRVPTHAPTCVYGCPVSDDSSIRYILTFTCGLEPKRSSPAPPKKEPAPETAAPRTA